MVCIFSLQQMLTDLFHINQQRLLVVFPLNGKLADVRKLIAGQLHRHLEAVSVKVTEVIHTCRKDTRVCNQNLFNYVTRANVKE